MDVIINESQLRFLIEGKLGYTKDGIIKIAKKYDNYTEFARKEGGAYDAARRFGPCYNKNGIEVNCYITAKKENPDSVRNSLEFFNEITSHMERISLTKDKIRDISKKYDYYTEFTRKERGAYDAARRFGPCYDGEGNKVDCYYRKAGHWNKIPGVHNTLEFFNEITSGMIRTDFGPKMVYSYTFFDDTKKVVGVYVGITNDEERRKGEHLTGKSTFTDKEVKSAVGKFIKENPTFKVEYTKLTEYIPFVEVQVKEEEYVNNAKSNGYNILNIAKTGSGGASFGVPDKYLIDKVNDWIKTTKEKGKKPLLNDFTNDYNNIYQNISKRKRKGNDKLYGETLGKLVKTIKKPDDQIIKRAQEWIDMKKSKKEIPFLSSYSKDFINDYNTITTRRRNGNEKLYNDTLGKMVSAQQKKTEEELIEFAMSCNSYTEFITKYDNFYRQAIRKGLILQIQQMFADGLNTPDQTTPETTPSV